jgi:hypothetical protein
VPNRSASAAAGQSPIVSPSFEGPIMTRAFGRAKARRRVSRTFPRKHDFARALGPDPSRRAVYRSLWRISVPGIVQDSLPLARAHPASAGNGDDPMHFSADVQQARRGACSCRLGAASTTSKGHAPAKANATLQRAHSECTCKSHRIRNLSGSCEEHLRVREEWLDRAPRRKTSRPNWGA